MLPIALVLTVLLQVVAAASVGIDETQYVRRAQTPTLECITLLQVKEYEDGSSDSEWHCQILERSTASNGIRGNIVPIADIGKIPKTLINQFESARTLLIVPGGTIGASGGLEVPNSNLIRVEKIPDDGSRARRLEGDNVNIRVIVIRVTAGTDPVYSTTANATKISDRVFGTDGDEVNLVSQYEQCSFGKLTVSPVTALNDGDPTLSAPGVYEVQVSSTDNTNNSILRTAIIHQLNADWPSSPLPESFKTQVSGTSPFDHIMICMPPETQGVGIAYAYVNSWLSVFKNNWCLYPTAQMHEIGHNLGFAHSGEGTQAYEDRSGTMGVSFANDEGPKFCFNAAKSWQWKWYDDKAETVVPSTTTNWSGRLMGIVDYQDEATGTVLVKIETDTFLDYYLKFNRKASFNSGTEEGGDKVMLVSQGGNGESYSQSYLQAKLEQGQSFDILDFGGESLYTVTVAVTEINLLATPAYADVTISAKKGIQINCGGPPFNDGDVVWESDTSYLSAGSTRTYGIAANKIAGAETSSLRNVYRTERYSISSATSIPMTYTITSIVEGYYDIYLYMAEIYEGAFDVGKRVFDVRIQNNILVQDVDVFALAGAGNKAHILKVEKVFINDSLQIELLRKKQNPKISGIEVKASPGIFINVGGPTYNDGTKIWRADNEYVKTEGTGVFRTTNPIEGTTLDKIYQDDRFDNSDDGRNMIFTIKLPVGYYDISLHWAETYFNSENQRIFNVLLEGNVEFENIDIFKDAGYMENKAYIGKKTRFLVMDGQLEIEFEAVKQRPKVCAIEILPSTPLPVKAYWRYCTKSSCSFYVENSSSEDLKLTSMTIDWPVSPTTLTLPTLWEVRQGYVSVWQLTKDRTPPQPYDVLSSWESGTEDERQIGAKSRKEFIIQFNKDAVIDDDLHRYTVQLSLTDSMSISETVVVESGGPDYVILQPSEYPREKLQKLGAL